MAIIRITKQQVKKAKKLKRGRESFTNNFSGTRTGEALLAA